MQYSSREEAHRNHAKTYFTGIPCKGGHVAERYTSTGGCLGCLGKYRKVAANPFTKTLVPMAPPEGLMVPHDMTPEHYTSLHEYLHDCVRAWVHHQGLITEEREKAYTLAKSHRIARAKK